MLFSKHGVNLVLVSALLVLGVVVASAWVAAQPQEQVIRVSAKKFAFTPDTIVLKRGVPVILEFTTEDVLMGFNVPELGLRADIVPGQTSRLRIVPGKVGNYPFICDIFCGAGHEEMAGVITVVD